MKSIASLEGKKYECANVFPAVHDDVVKWKHFPRYWPFVRGIHWSSVNSAHQGQWRGALICALKKLLGKQSLGWWFEMPSRPLWRQSNAVEEEMAPSCDSNWCRIKLECFLLHHVSQERQCKRCYRDFLMLIWIRWCEICKNRVYY